MRKAIKRFWTDEEVNYLNMCYEDVPTRDIAKSLNRSVTQVYNKANGLGLNKSASYMEQELQRQAERLRKAGSGYRYRKGNIPVNKGRAMPAEVYERCRATMFKKGNEPHNTNYDGHIRISRDGYQEIRIRKGKYRLRHLVNWEAKNGKLPKGHCLRAKDGNKQNVDPENWELISRAENMALNTIHRYPEELKITIKVLSKLKRKINEKQNRRS